MFKNKTFCIQSAGILFRFWRKNQAFVTKASALDITLVTAASIVEVCFLWKQCSKNKFGFYNLLVKWCKDIFSYTVIWDIRSLKYPWEIFRTQNINAYTDFFKIGVLKNSAIFAGKHLCCSLFLVNLHRLSGLQLY